MNEDTASPACHRNGDVPNGKLETGDVREIANGAYSRERSASLSPSLWKDREEPAFELKFQLSQQQARDVAAWAAEHLNIDPHCRPELDYAYHIHGLYFDTPALDVFHRSPGYKRKKYRLRRYGSDVLIFLEQKRKSAGKVAKRRVQVDEAELERLREAPTDLDWHASWFHRRIATRRLAPTCLISYDRQAYFGHNAEGPLRLTLDRRVRCREADQWMVEPVETGIPMLMDEILLELKYRRHLPALFKGLVQDFALAPGPLSKYRLAIQALGRGNGAGGPVDV
jgi:VTC domain